MSSIAEALKRAQQDRERLRNPSESGAEQERAPEATAYPEASLAAVVLKRKSAPAPQPVDAVPTPFTAATAATAAPAAPDAPERTAVAPMTAPPVQTPIAAAMQQGVPQAAPVVRHEQRMAETIVEDYTSKRRLNLPASMVVYHDRAGAVAAQYRKMRDNLMAACMGHGSRKEAQVLVLTSAKSGEGKTVTALNLGLSLVEVRANRVLLVDGCLGSNRRRPGLTDLLRLGSERGLAELLAAPAGEAGLERIEHCLKATPWHNLFVLPAGARTTAAAAAALLQSQNLRGILRKVRANFDWVLIDAPAAADLPDAGLLGACSDGMLMAVALHRTPQEMVQRTIRRLRSMNLPVKSCIVTRA